LSDTAEPAQLHHLDWALSSSDPRIHNLLLEKSNGAFDLIFWQEISSYDVRSQAEIQNPSVNAQLAIGRQAKQITLYDPVRQSQPIAAYKNMKSIPLAIPDEPLVVEIRF
jgi:hypothetical protein